MTQPELGDAEITIGPQKNTVPATRNPTVNSVLFVNLAKISIMIYNTIPIRTEMPLILSFVSFFMAFRFRNTQQI